MAQPLEQFAIADHDGAAVDRRDDLDGIEAEARDVAEAAQHPAVGAAAEGVGGVLDDPQAMALGHRVELLESAGPPAEVQREHRLRLRSHERGRLVRIEAERGVVHVAQDRRGAGGHDRLVVRHEVEGRRDHLVAGADAGGEQAEVEGGGAGVGGQHVAIAQLEEAREPLLERLRDGAHAEPAGVQRVHDRLDRVHADVRLEDRDGRVLSHSRTSGTRPART